MIRWLIFLTVAFGAGWFSRGLKPWWNRSTQTPPTDAPLPDDEYRSQRERLVQAYGESIKEYDRLVTWASAGGLGLSITFIEKFGKDADRGTAWMLAAGWIALCVAFAASLWSQYFSSRIHSWRTRELDHCQEPPVDEVPTWAAEAARLHRIASRYGKLTKWSTAASGLLLVGGIAFLAWFAFANAPFKAVQIAAP